MSGAHQSWGRLRRWLGPPEQSTLELTQRAYALWVITWGSFAFAAAGMIVLFIKSDASFEVYLLSNILRLGISLLLLLADEVELYQHDAAFAIRSLANNYRYSELLHALEARS